MQNLVYEGVVTTLKSLGGDIFRERVMLSSGRHPLNTLKSHAKKKKPCARDSPALTKAS